MPQVLEIGFFFFARYRLVLSFLMLRQSFQSKSSFLLLVFIFWPNLKLKVFWRDPCFFLLFFFLEFDFCFQISFLP